MKLAGIVWILLCSQTSALTTVTKSINKFVTDIDKILTHNNEFSSVLCPFNLHLGLSLLLQGAGGGTYRELATLLGLEGSRQDNAASYRALLDKLTGDSFKTWTCMIPGENVDLKQEFVRSAYKYFKAGAAGASQVDGEEETDVTLKYCNQIGSRPKTTKLQIFSKAGLNSSWKKPFLPSNDGEFIVSPGKAVKTMMMKSNDIFAFKEDPELRAKVLKIDYMEDGWSMLIILPINIDISLSSLQSKISKSPLHNLMRDLKEVKLKVSFPKFNTNAFKFHRDVKFLEKMGAKELFSNEADFHDIASGEGMHLSHVLIEAFISVNETGTLAGSGADFLAGGGDELPQISRKPSLEQKTSPVSQVHAPKQEPGPPSFKANHPFLFYIVGPSDVFLYSGKIVNPVNTNI